MKSAKFDFEAPTTAKPEREHSPTKYIKLLLNDPVDCDPFHEDCSGTRQHKNAESDRNSDDEVLAFLSKQLSHTDQKSATAYKDLNVELHEHLKKLDDLLSRIKTRLSDDDI